MVNAGRSGGDASYAGWTRRAAAHVLDGVIAGLPLSIVGFAIAQVSVPLAVGTTSAAYASYFVLGHGGRSGQTPAKRLFGIAVRTVHGGGRVGYRRAFVRFCALVALGLTGALVVVDFVWPLRDRRRRAWHDKAAGTVVVRQEGRR